jgi:PRTRC genetic system protein E
MFFTYFKQIMSPGVDYNLTISQTAAGDLVVILLPKVRDLKDTAQHQIGPLIISGSPQDLDREFFPKVTTPIQKTAGILLDMKGYEQQQKAAESESKAVKDEKNKAATEAKAKREKYDGFMKKAGELEAAGDFDNALTQLQQARLHAADKVLKTVDEKIAALKGKMNQGSLFDVPAVQPAATVPPAAAAPQPAPVAPQPAPAAPHPVAVPVSPQQAAPQPAGQMQNPAQPPLHPPMAAPMPAPPQPAPGFGMFGPPAGQPIAAQPAPRPAAPSWPAMDAPAYRGNEYEEIVDFPSEMLPPVYNRGMAAGAM